MPIEDVRVKKEKPYTAIMQFATSASDSSEPTLISPPMRSANSELIDWYEMILDPAMDTYFETHPDLTWVTTTIQTERKPIPLVLVGAKDENSAGWNDFKQVIEPKLASAPCAVNLSVENQRIQYLSAADYDSNQAVDEDASAVHESDQSVNEDASAVHESEQSVDKDVSSKGSKGVVQPLPLTPFSLGNSIAVSRHTLPGTLGYLYI